MPYCGKCGTSVAADSIACPSCGAPRSPMSAPPVGPGQPPEYRSAPRPGVGQLSAQPPTEPLQFGEQSQYGERAQFGEQVQYGQPQAGTTSYGQPQYGYDPAAAQQHYSWQAAYGQPAQQPPQPYQQPYQQPSRQSGYTPAPPDPEVTTTNRPRRKKTPVIIAVVAAVVVAVAGVTWWATSSSTAGTGFADAEAAAAGLFDAIDDGDLLGLLDMLPPGERDTFSHAINRAMDAAKSNGLLAEDADFEAFTDRMIDFSNVRFGNAKELSDEVSIVPIRGLTVTARGYVSDIPFGDRISREIDSDSLREGGTWRASLPDLLYRTNLDAIGWDPVIAVVLSRDGWHPSVLYTAATMVNAGIGISDRISNPVQPVGASSPEEAVEELIQAAADLDVDGVISMLDPQGEAVLYDYGSRWYDEAERQFPGLPTMYVDDLSVTAGDADGGFTPVRIEALAGTFEYSEDGTCYYYDSYWEESDTDDCRRSLTADVNWDGDCIDGHGTESAEYYYHSEEDYRSDSDWYSCDDDYIRRLDLGEAAVLQTVKVDGKWFVSASSSATDFLIRVMEWNYNR